MDPKDIAKLITDLDFNDGVIVENNGTIEIPEGYGPFDIYFNRGTIARVNLIAKSDLDDSLYYAGIDPSGFCFKTHNRKVPKIFIMESNRFEAKVRYDIDLPRRRYVCPFKHMISFNAKNVIKVVRSETSNP